MVLSRIEKDFSALSSAIHRQGLEVVTHKLSLQRVDMGIVLVSARLGVTAPPDLKFLTFYSTRRQIL